MPDPAADRSVPAADEARHEPSADPLWNESWYFDFATPDGDLGGYARLGLYPNLGVAWWWACLVRAGEPLLLVRHHEVDIPRRPGLEVRAEGLWAALYCEEPLDHWTVGLEAFAVALDDPVDALDDERGELTPLGFDLEWESMAPAYGYPGVDRYEVSCRVTGEVLVGAQERTINAWGQRDHSWGTRDWWTFPWTWMAGRLDDGTAFHGSRPDIDGVDYAPGYSARDGATTEARGLTAETEFASTGLPARSRVVMPGLGMDATPIAHAPLRLEAPDGRVGHLARALCRFDADDGRAGFGWGEWNRPPPPAGDSA